MIVIVDYGVGNLESIRNMFKKIGVQAVISSAETDILQAEKLVLPGVGAFDSCAQKINASGLIESLKNRVLVERIPVLGICVGMQLLMEESEEGSLKGLGWLPGRVVRFQRDRMPDGTKIPHIGWAEVVQEKSSGILSDLPEEPRFYFVHSFHVVPENLDDVLMSSDYGYRFTAAVQRDNITGVQFHPEKSHKYGMKLLENFARNY